MEDVELFFMLDLLIFLLAPVLNSFSLSISSSSPILVTIIPILVIHVSVTLPSFDYSLMRILDLNSSKALIFLTFSFCQSSYFCNRSFLSFSTLTFSKTLWAILKVVPILGLYLYFMWIAWCYPKHSWFSQTSSDFVVTQYFVNKCLILIWLKCSNWMMPGIWTMEKYHINYVGKYVNKT